MRQRAVLAESYSGGDGHYTRKDIKLAFYDVKTYVSGVCMFCGNIVLYGQRPGSRLLPNPDHEQALAHSFL